MKERLTQLLELFKEANPATRTALVISTLIIIGLAGVSSWYANRPDFVQVWSELNSAEAASYKSALAEAGISFRSSPPPENGIWVDTSRIHEAEAAVALGGSQPQSRGIPMLEGGAGGVFLGANTRAQMRDKRDWQECELMLETLDFVNSATVVGSGNDRTPFARGEPQTISVTLDLRHGSTLTPAEAKNVATLVRARFNVPMENITIMDRRGDLLHDGTTAAAGGSGEDLFDQKRRFDEIAARNANLLLEDALGAGMARVTVSSEWSYEETESIDYSVIPDETAVINQSKSETSKPVSSDEVGGPAGVSSNLTADFGTENAGVAPPTLAPGGEAKTKEEEKQSVVGRKTKHSRSQMPQIKRLSIALIVDTSITDDLDSLGSMIKAAVGFDEKRGDEFQLFSATLASVERDEAGKPIPVEKPEPTPPPNEYLLLALEHGVEILAALAFVLILLKTLRGASAGRKKGGSKAAKAAAVVAAEQEAQEAEAAAAEALDPALLARVQVEELVRSDPERVGEILTQWAREEPQKVGAEQ